MTGESAAVVAMQQLVAEMDRAPFGLSRSSRHALARFAALAERRATLRRGEPAREPDGAVAPSGPDRATDRSS